MGANKHFDYVIIGCGVAGLHLAYQISKDTFFSTKSIAIIDSSIIPIKNRVLSFWEDGYGSWDKVVFKKWNRTIFSNKTNKIVLDLAPYVYKSLNFKDFSEYCVKNLNSNFSLVEQKVISLTENESDVCIETNREKFTATHVFDSRFSGNYNSQKSNFPAITQSFKGWWIKTEIPVFNSDTFTMMDYRFQWKDSNSFMYILPKSSTVALLEYTFFSKFIITDVDFEKQLKSYMSTFFSKTTYKVLEVEAGKIPMTTYPFNKDSSLKITKIGTAGGWVKASTGYSFKFAEKNAKAIVSQLKKGDMPIGYKQSKRFRFYDSLFIKVLEFQNSKGPHIFFKMYQKVSPSILFRFLDEETTLLEEIKIILKLPYVPFLKALLKR